MAMLLSCLVMCVQYVEHDSVRDKVRFIHHSLFQVRVCPYSQDIRHRPVNWWLIVWPWKMATSRSQRTFSEKYIHCCRWHLASNCSSALWSIVSASPGEMHQSAADRVDNDDRNVETCQCHATRLHASVHPHSERLLSICGSIKMHVSSSSSRIREIQHFLCHQPFDPIDCHYAKQFLSLRHFHSWKPAFTTKKSPQSSIDELVIYVQRFVRRNTQKNVSHESSVVSQLHEPPYMPLQCQPQCWTCSWNLIFQVLIY